MLQNLYARFPGRWSREYEATYLQLANNVRLFNSSSSDQRNQLITENGQDVWNTWFQAYEHARLARLISFLRQREPDSEINYSILIYQLSTADLERAIEGPPIELLESNGFSDSPVGKAGTSSQRPD